jgi:cytochrome c oxidase subunit 2
MQNQLGDVLTMEAIGHQFKYEFRYPRLKASVFDDMHLPVGTPVTLYVTSEDVLHSFWVPEVRLKADMVPGLVQTLRFTPEKIGTYRIICTEFCGVNHGDMLATLHIDSQQDFGRWLAAQFKAEGQDQGALVLSKGVADRGRELFGQKCSTCHSTGPFQQKIVGPGLGRLLADPAHPNLVTGKPPAAQNVAAILQNGYSGPDLSQGPPGGPTLGVMPNRQANALTNSDISNLTAYVLSLSKK